MPMNVCPDCGGVAAGETRMEAHRGSRRCRYRAAKTALDARGLVQGGGACYAHALVVGFPCAILDGNGVVHERADDSQDFGEGRHALDRRYYVEPWVRELHVALGSAAKEAKRALLLRCAGDAETLDLVLTGYRLSGERGARQIARVVLERKWDIPNDPPPGTAVVRSRRAAP